jgi:two-component system nitrogen regulation response regulator NtrX
VVPIVVPDLVDRREDIPQLVADFINQFSRKGIEWKQFSAEALSLLQRHTWPGNIRELRNLVERLVIMTPGDEINVEDVALFLGNAPLLLPPTQPIDPVYRHLGFKDARRRFETDYLLAKLEENDGNISKTAEQIGMERSHLHKKVKALGIAVK